MNTQAPPIPIAPSAPAVTPRRLYFAAHALTRALGWTEVNMSVCDGEIRFMALGGDVAEKRANLYDLALAVRSTVTWDPSPDSDTYAGALQVAGTYHGVPVSGFLCLTPTDAARLGYGTCEACGCCAHVEPCRVGIIDRDGLPACCNCGAVIPAPLTPSQRHHQDTIDDRRDEYAMEARRDAAYDAAADAGEPW